MSVPIDASARSLRRRQRVRRAASDRPVRSGTGCRITSWTERVFDTLKRIFVGRPLATSEQEHQRITEDRSRWRCSPRTPSRRPRTRPRRSSSSPRSGPSSLALGLDRLVPIAIAVALLLAIVVTSYRQTIFAYPSGGGSYIVSRENLGEIPALVAAASLLVDYILTVAVSISAGVAAIVSIPQFECAREPSGRARLS